MRQAITTRYLGPTNTKGSRIKAVARKADAWGKEQSCIISRDQALGIEAVHLKAAKACAINLDWRGLWVGGGTMDGDGFVFVCLGGVNPRLLTSDALSAMGVEDTDWFWLPAGRLSPSTTTTLEKA